MAKKAEEKTLFVKSAIKELIKSQEMKTSSELLEEGTLNAKIKEIIVRACERAKENKRSTVYSRDV